MQMDHLGSGLYIDRRTLTKYDYEEDAKDTDTISRFALVQALKGGSKKRMGL